MFSRSKCCFRIKNPKRSQVQCETVVNNLDFRWKLLRYIIYLCIVSAIRRIRSSIIWHKIYQLQNITSTIGHVMRNMNSIYTQLNVARIHTIILTEYWPVSTTDTNPNQRWSWYDRRIQKRWKAFISLNRAAWKLWRRFWPWCENSPRERWIYTGYYNFSLHLPIFPKAAIFMFINATWLSIDLKCACSFFMLFQWKINVCMELKMVYPSQHNTLTHCCWPNCEWIYSREAIQ